MKRLRGYKVELEVNNRQRTRLAQHAGVARFAYNWGLAQKQAAYAAGQKSPNAMALHKLLNTLKDTEFPWMRESSKYAPQEALRDLDRAYDNFFRRIKEKKAGKDIKPGFPKFKSKHRNPASFRLYGVNISTRTIRLPILGKLRLKEHGYLPVDGTPGVHVLGATVSERAGRWFVAVRVEVEVNSPNPDVPDLRPAVGIDVGLRHLATLSDGTVIPNPRWLKSKQRKVARLQQALSRTRRQSKNRQKARRLLAIAHYRVSNARKDTLHKLTTTLVKTKSVIGIEDLGIRGMMQNHTLAGAISDVGWGEFRRQLTYKTEWYGSRLVLAPRFAPTTKQCSNCGAINTIKLDESTYRCSNCSLSLDRDLNAARNILAIAVAASSADTINACSREHPDSVSALPANPAVGPSQEPNAICRRLRLLQMDKFWRTVDLEMTSRNRRQLSFGRMLHRQYLGIAGEYILLRRKSL